MNFEITKSKIIPFTINDIKAKETLIQFITSHNCAPLDVAYQSKIKSIQYIYYPVRFFNIKYTADWSATSIWKEKEAYNVQETVTVYYDYHGQEHSKPGFDHFSSHGSYTHSSSTAGGDHVRPWTPQQKLVNKTKYRTVITNTEQTYGNIGTHSTTQPIICTDINNENIQKWIASFPTNKVINYSDSLVQNCEIKELHSTDYVARDMAIKNTKRLVEKKCHNAIPGTEYRDLIIDNFETNVEMEIYLYPVCIISYSHNTTDYELWINGNKPTELFATNQPLDNNLISNHQQLKTQIENDKSIKSKFGCITFFVFPIVFFLSLIFCMGDECDSSLLLVEIILEILIIKLRSELQKKIDKETSMVDTYFSEIRQIRNSITNIALSTEIDEQSKVYQITQLINSQPFIQCNDNYISTEINSANNTIQ